ncbi:MAG: hypothetical protein EOM67_02180 [Spirochaetia bacterium]|nr:hypothetical protein [Spirochaetia bacterium]
MLDKEKVHVGIDVGTTNITIVSCDISKKEVPITNSLPNKKIDTKEKYSYAQDPLYIEEMVKQLLILEKRSIASITVTGQVHGILYVDKDGKAVSPLYTWLDQRGMIEIDGISSQLLLKERTGAHLPSGYGLLTHYANRRMGKVPPSAVGFCGILEYITGRLIGSPLQKSDPSTLGTYGSYNPIKGTFDQKVLDEVMGSDKATFLTPSSPFEIAGYTTSGIPVTYPVGDNQAGFFGMVSSWESSALISIGTSGQLSLCSTSKESPPTMELRPFFGTHYLHVGATLTAGKAYEVLHSFIKSLFKASHIDIDDGTIFDIMKESARNLEDIDPLVVDTRLSGTRREPTMRGSITNIGLSNFTIGNMVKSTVDGIIGELQSFKEDSPRSFEKIERIIATGSSVRKNYLFKEALQRSFDRDSIIAEVDDGAGFGAALIGTVATKRCTIEETSKYIHTLLGT